MYRCQSCKCITNSGEKENTIVIQIRPKIYQYTKKIEDEKGRKKKLSLESAGSEIVKEIKICYNCVEEINGNG